MTDEAKTLLAVMIIACLAALAFAGLDTVEKIMTHGDIVLPTCKELNDVGYDGLSSCTDENGKILTPGKDN